jgi:hypothetical protein
LEGDFERIGDECGTMIAILSSLMLSMEAAPEMLSVRSMEILLKCSIDDFSS